MVLEKPVTFMFKVDFAFLLKMEAEDSYKTFLTIYQSTWCYNLKARNLNIYNY
jgi:hypothetical protein